MTNPHTAAFLCTVCGSVYPEAALAKECEGIAADPEVHVRGTHVRPREAGAGTGLGWVTGSFLLGLGDPRGDAHTRFYRASFLWGRADFREGELESLGVVTEAEWREAVARGDQ